ncbi:MAG TPA: MATE family efflux transporter [Candidatus Eisenbacteria bacterium]|nr:MATE family efflux transporter [Candidatus Eisenbacteria bacterium]
MQDLTKGSITGHLLKTTSFMLVTMLFQTLYFLIDLYWVGRLGKEAVAAVSISGNLTFIVLAVSQMLGVGTTTLISHAVGQKDRERTQVVFNQSQVLSILVALVFLVLGMSVRTFYCERMAADAETARLAGQYLLWFIPAMTLQFALVSMGAALRGSGNFKPGMIVGTGSIIINMILAPFLIFGWLTHRPLGVAGAALASLIAIVIGTVWYMKYFPKGGFLEFRPREWKPQFDLWGKLLSIGMPAGAEFGLMSVYLVVIYAVIRPFGASAQAGFGIGMRVIQSAFMPVVALGFSVGPVAGQNVGARLPARVLEAYRMGAILAVSLMGALAILFHIAPAAMIGVFSHDPEVIAVGVDYLKIISWSFFFSGLIYVNSSMFQALGNTIPSMLASFTRIVLVAVPAVLLSRQPGFELRWIWYLSVATIGLQLVLSSLFLRREFRIRLKSLAPVESPETLEEVAATEAAASAVP